MSVVANPIAPRDPGRCQQGFASRILDHPWLLHISLAIVCFAFLPVLLSYLPTLWGRQYYRFFPFAFAATFALAIMRAAKKPNLEASSLRWGMRFLIFAIAEIALIGGIMLGSPWPCFVAVILCLGLVLDFWNEADSDRSLVYLLLPVVLVIRPPLHLDETAIQQLQTITSKLASAFLSAVDVDHILSGNIIQPLNGPALLVEEACSGVQSLFTLMFIAAFLGVYRRYTLTRTILLVTSSVFWALMMNVFRVIAIALAQTQFDMDLTTGWKHEVVGYAGILLAVFFLISTDRFLLFFFGGIPDDSMKNASVNVLVSAWNWLLVSPGFHPSETLPPADTTNRFGRNRISSILQPETPRTRQALIAMSAIAGITFISAIPAWGLLVGEVRLTTNVLDLSSVDASWLPESSLSGCRVLQFDIEQRDATSQFGSRSEKWIVSTKEGNVLHSMDHSFDGWHNLTTCYRSIGWRLQKIEDRQIADSDESKGWPIVYAEFIKPTGEYAFLCFSLFTVDGQAVMPEGETGGLAGVQNRLRQSSLKGQQTIQVQTLFETLAGGTPETSEHLVRMHSQVRAALKQQVVERQSHTPLPIENPKASATPGDQR